MKVPETPPEVLRDMGLLPSGWTSSRTETLRRLALRDRNRTAFEFDESLHPRGEGGRWGPGDGGSKTPKGSGKHTGKGGKSSGRGGGGKAPAPKAPTAEQIRGGKETSAAKFKDENGKYTPERQALHAEIINKFLEGKVPPEGRPSVTFLGGGPAAGKSSVENSGEAGIPDTKGPDAVLMNPDEIKGMLPEYDQLLQAGDKGAAAFTHQESSDISKQLLAEAVGRGMNVVVDGTGNTSVQSMMGKIEAAQTGDHEIHAVYVTVPTEVAQERAAIRGEETGRVVPPEVIDRIHASVSQMVPEIAPVFDSFRLYDTNGRQGDPPVLIAQTTKDTPVSVVNQAKYDEFLSKGHV